MSDDVRISSSPLQPRRSSPIEGSSLMTSCHVVEIRVQRVITRSRVYGQVKLRVYPVCGESNWNTVANITRRCSCDESATDIRLPIETGRFTDCPADVTLASVHIDEVSFSDHNHPCTTSLRPPWSQTWATSRTEASRRPSSTYPSPSRGRCTTRLRTKRGSCPTPVSAHRRVSQSS